MELTKLQKEILQALKVVNFYDRDLRTITIYLNPNYVRRKEDGSEKEIKILQNKKG